MDHPTNQQVTKIEKPRFANMSAAKNRVWQSEERRAASPQPSDASCGRLGRLTFEREAE
jgi:hypothetical protein